jgi:RNA polymerase sigma-70 factor, ECF subfamily
MLPHPFCCVVMSRFRPVSSKTVGMAACVTTRSVSQVPRHMSGSVFYGRFVLGEGFPKVLRAAADGDGAAFAMLWRDTHPPLLRYLWVAAGDAAEDVASEVWLEVARRIAKFKGGEPEFRGWLFTLARRKVIDRHRYEARHPESPTGDAEPLDRPASDDTFAAALEDISTGAALALIASLPPEQAEIIVLRVVVGMDATEVARMVGKSPGAVRVAAHRGLRLLSARLASAASVPADPRDEAADPGGVTL